MSYQSSEFTFEIDVSFEFRGGSFRIKIKIDT